MRLERAGQRKHVADVVVDHQHVLAFELGGGARRHLLRHVLGDRRRPRLGGDARRHDEVGFGRGCPRELGRRLIAKRQVEREGAALPRRAVHADLAAQEPRQLAADREPEAGAAVLAAGGAVGLLEGLEDQALLVGRDADAGVDHRERDHGVGAVEHRMA